MGAEFIIDNMEDMCNLMCNNQVPEKMTRKELANKMFLFLKHNTNRKEKDIWKAIAETDDYSLFDEFEKNARKINADEQIEGQMSLFDG